MWDQETSEIRLAYNLGSGIQNHAGKALDHLSGTTALDDLQHHAAVKLDVALAAEKR